MQIPSKNYPTSSKQKNDDVKSPAGTIDVLNMLRHGGRGFLSTLKKKSIRVNNSWYRLLSLDKRRFIDAVIQTVDKIRSSLLLKILSPIVGKLLQALGGIRGLIGDLAYSMQNFGQPLAKRVSIIAKGWGNNQAAKWACDEGFIRFLSVIDMNDLPIFKVSNKR